MENGRVRLTVDLHGAGKARGHIIVPISTDDSAYGSKMVPVTVVRSGTGPTVLLTGGVHGDEYEGPLVLTRLAREVEPADVAGGLVILPALNLAALEAGCRNSPLDGLNLNRIFPGRIEGGPSEMLAHFVTAALLPACDVLVDLHSGGRSLLYAPLAATHLVGQAERDRRALEALLSFEAPYALIARDLDTQGLLDYTAEAMGKLVISTELGGGGTVSPMAVRIGERGVRGLLHHLGVLRSAPSTPTPVSGSRLLAIGPLDSYALSPHSGVYEPVVELCEEVAVGQTLGFLHRFDDTGDPPPRPVLASRSGLLICRRGQGSARTGDCLGIVAEEPSQVPAVQDLLSGFASPSRGCLES